VPSLKIVHFPDDFAHLSFLGVFAALREIFFVSSLASVKNPSVFTTWL
jgi:hypothetical protein